MEKIVYKKVEQKSDKEKLFVPLYTVDDGLSCVYRAGDKQVGFSTKKDVENFLAKKKEAGRHFVEVKRVIITYLPFKTKKL